jgi:hypothetical protein
VEPLPDHPTLWIQSPAAQRLVDATGFLPTAQIDEGLVGPVVAVVTSQAEAKHVIDRLSGGARVDGVVTLGVDEATILNLVRSGLSVGAGMLNRTQIIDLTVGRGAIALAEAEALADIERTFAEKAK